MQAGTKKGDKRIAELSKILTKLYEDVALEKISEERYQSMAPGYEREQEVLKEKREELTAEIAHCEEIYENIEAFLPVIWKYTNITELMSHILNELIEKSVVHEKVVAEDGSKSQQVDIHYKFIGCVNWKREPASYGTIEAAVLQEHQTLSEADRLETTRGEPHMYGSPRNFLFTAGAREAKPAGPRNLFLRPPLGE